MQIKEIFLLLLSVHHVKVLTIKCDINHTYFIIIQTNTLRKIEKTNYLLLI